MEENTMFTDTLFHIIIPLFGGFLLAFFLSWIFVTRYVAKKKTKEQAKRIGKIHYRIGLGIMLALLVFQTVRLIFVENDIAYHSFLIDTFIVFNISAFFYWNNWMIKRKIFRVDMFGDKIDN